MKHRTGSLLRLVHAVQPSEKNEYSILAGKAPGKYLLGK
jgi:hypothetical protein